MYKLWNEIKRVNKHESFIAEVFSIEMKNDLHIIQFPNILISDKFVLYQELYKINKVSINNNINKEMIEYHFDPHGTGAKKLIILKNKVYWYIDLYFIGILLI